MSIYGPSSHDSCSLLQPLFAFSPRRAGARWCGRSSRSVCAVAEDHGAFAHIARIRHLVKRLKSRSHARPRARQPSTRRGTVHRPRLRTHSCTHLRRLCRILPKSRSVPIACPPSLTCHEAVLWRQLLPLSCHPLPFLSQTVYAHLRLLPRPRHSTAHLLGKSHSSHAFSEDAVHAVLGQPLYWFSISSVPHRSFRRDRI